MTRHLVPAALVALAVAGPTAVPATAVPDSERAGDGYSGWTACSLKGSAKHTHTCRLSQVKAAFFVSTKRDATYKVCVRFPGGKRLCASAQDAPRGQKELVTIATSKTGTHTVTWYVAGVKVDTWKLRVTEG